MMEVDTATKGLVCQACWDKVFFTEAWRSVLADEMACKDSTEKGHTYITTWPAIKSSAAICNWCKLLPQRKVDGEAQVSIRYQRDTGYTPAGDKFLTVVVKDLKDGSAFSTQDLLLYTTKDNKAAKVIKARDRITDLFTEESFRLAKGCIDYCVREHRRGCPPLRNSSLLPDRVIDCADTSNPKIVLTGGKTRGSYVALSYVWGGPQPMLTTKNVDQYTTSGLKMAEFPQSIRDAVTVTNKIGERYLWIDALCILQNSREDKLAQLGKMHAIYKNSSLTINAASSSSTHEGFLHQLRPQREPRTTIPFLCPDGAIGTAFVAYESFPSSEGPNKSYWDELEPITGRGWCYQEKMLPARSLVYASDTVKYYCQTETVNIGEALCEQSTGKRLPHGTYQLAETEHKPDRTEFRQSWLAALFQYTMRNLTVSSDKLPAFAAVAEQFSILNEDRYLAGLWRKTLLLDLLWKADYKFKRPVEYRAPSWSWASVDGLISGEWRLDALAHPENTDDTKNLRNETIIDCQVTVASSLTPFGEVTAGVLTLRALLLQVHSDEGTFERRITVGVDGERHEIGSVSTKFDTVQDWGDEIYAIPLLWNVCGQFMFGLVVVLDSGRLLQYRRIGRFERRNSPLDLGWMDVFPRQEIQIV